MNKKLALALQKMVTVDQEAIRRRQKTGVIDLRVFERHTRRMKKIVARYGWPTVSLVGKAGSKHAWLIVLADPRHPAGGRAAESIRHRAACSVCERRESVSTVADKEDHTVGGLLPQSKDAWPAS